MLPNLQVPHHLLRSSCTEVPSLHRRYPASAVLRTSPPPQGARPVPRGRPVGIADHARGFPGLRPLSLCTSRRQYPGVAAGRNLRSTRPAISAFPDMAVGSAHTSSFSRLAQRCLAVRARTLSLSPIRDTLIEGFSHFVTSMTAPIASGWSDCRVGFAPTGKRRLCTAHTRSGHQGCTTLVGLVPLI